MPNYIDKVYGAINSTPTIASISKEDFNKKILDDKFRESLYAELKKNKNIVLPDKTAFDAKIKSSIKEVEVSNSGVKDVVFYNNTKYYNVPTMSGNKAKLPDGKVVVWNGTEWEADGKIKSQVIPTIKTFDANKIYDYEKAMETNASKINADIAKGSSTQQAINNNPFDKAKINYDNEAKLNILKLEEDKANTLALARQLDETSPNAKLSNIRNTNSAVFYNIPNIQLVKSTEQMMDDLFGSDLKVSEKLTLADTFNSLTGDKQVELAKKLYGGNADNGIANALSYREQVRKELLDNAFNKGYSKEVNKIKEMKGLGYDKIYNELLDKQTALKPVLSELEDIGGQIVAIKEQITPLNIKRTGLLDEIQNIQIGLGEKISEVQKIDSLRYTDNKSYLESLNKRNIIVDEIGKLTERGGQLENEYNKIVSAFNNPEYKRLLDRYNELTNEVYSVQDFYNANKDKIEGYNTSLKELDNLGNMYENVIARANPKQFRMMLEAEEFQKKGDTSYEGVKAFANAIFGLQSAVANAIPNMALLIGKASELVGYNYESAKDPNSLVNLWRNRVNNNNEAENFRIVNRSTFREDGSINWGKTDLFIGQGLGSMAAFLAGGSIAKLGGIGDVGQILSTSMAINFNDALQTSKNAGLSIDESINYAFQTSVVQSALELVNPTYFTKYFGSMSTAKNAISDGLISVIKRGGSKEFVKEAMDIALKKAVFVGTDVTKEVAQELTRLLGDVLINTAYNKKLGKDVFDASLNKDVITETVLSTAFATGLLGAASSGINSYQSDKAIKEFAYTYPKQAEGILNSLRDNGKITVEKHAELTSLLGNYVILRSQVGELMNEANAPIVVDLIEQKNRLQNSISQIEDEDMKKIQSLYLKEINDKIARVVSEKEVIDINNVLGNITENDLIQYNDKLGAVIFDNETPYFKSGNVKVKITDQKGNVANKSDLISVLGLKVLEPVMKGDSIPVNFNGEKYLVDGDKVYIEINNKAYKTIISDEDRKAIINETNKIQTSDKGGGVQANAGNTTQTNLGEDNRDGLSDTKDSPPNASRGENETQKGDRKTDSISSVTLLKMPKTDINIGDSVMYINSDREVENDNVISVDGDKVTLKIGGLVNANLVRVKSDKTFNNKSSLRPNPLTKQENTLLDNFKPSDLYETALLFVAKELGHGVGLEMGVIDPSTKKATPNSLRSYINKDSKRLKIYTPITKGAEKISISEAGKMIEQAYKNYNDNYNEQEDDGVTVLLDVLNEFDGVTNIRRKIALKQAGKLQVDSNISMGEVESRIPNIGVIYKKIRDNVNDGVGIENIEFTQDEIETLKSLSPEELNTVIDELGGMPIDMYLQGALYDEVSNLSDGDLVVDDMSRVAATELENTITNAMLEQHIENGVFDADSAIKSTPKELENNIKKIYEDLYNEQGTSTKEKETINSGISNVISEEDYTGERKIVQNESQIDYFAGIEAPNIETAGTEYGDVNRIIRFFETILGRGIFAPFNEYKEKLSELGFGSSQSMIADNGLTPDGVRLLNQMGGRIMGFVSDGKIYLNPDNLSANTVFHELTHIQQNAITKAANDGDKEAQQILDRFDVLVSNKLDEYVSNLKNLNTPKSINIGGVDIDLSSDVYLQGISESDMDYRRRLRNEIWAYLQQPVNLKKWEHITRDGGVRGFIRAIQKFFKRVLGLHGNKNIQSMTLEELIDASSNSLYKAEYIKDSNGIITEWVSRISKAIKNGRTQTGGNWLRWIELKHNEGVLSKDEAYWTGLNSFLYDNIDVKISKQEIQDFLGYNQVTISEKVVTTSDISRQIYPVGDMYTEIVLLSNDVSISEDQESWSVDDASDDRVIGLARVNTIKSDKGEKVLLINEITSSNEQTEGWARPNTPFSDQNSWSRLVISRVLNYAIKNGYDYITISDGEDINSMLNKNGRYTYKDGVLTIDNGGITQRQITDIELYKLLNRDIADRLIEDGEVENVTFTSTPFVAFYGSNGKKGVIGEILESITKQFDIQEIAPITVDLSPTLTPTGKNNEYIDTTTNEIVTSDNSKYKSLNSIKITDKIRNGVLDVGIPMFAVSNPLRLAILKAMTTATANGGALIDFNSIGRYLISTGRIALIPEAKAAYNDIVVNEKFHPTIRLYLSTPEQVNKFNEFNVEAELKGIKIGEDIFNSDSDSFDLAIYKGESIVQEDGKPSLVYENIESIPTPAIYVTENIIDKHQALGVNMAITHFLDRGGKSFLLADGAGVGKTMEALVIADIMSNKTGLPSLIITKNTQIISQRFNTDLLKLGIDNTLIKIATYDQLVNSKIEDLEYGVIVYDEAHVFKNPKSERAQVSSILKTFHTVFMTATPMDKIEGFMYFLPQVLGVSQEYIQDKLRVTMLWNGERFIPAKMNGFDINNFLKNLSELRHEAISKGAMLRRYYPFYGTIGSKDVEIPQMVKTMIEELDKYYAPKIKKLRSDLGFTDNNTINNADLDKTKFDRQFLLRRMYENRKNDINKLLHNGRKWHILRDVINYIDKGFKVIVASDYVNELTTKDGKTIDSVIKFLSEELPKEGIPHVKIYGNEDKKSAVDKFNFGDADIVLMSQKSGGTGIDLDDTIGDSPRVLLLVEAPNSGDTFEQVIGRISRRNTKSKSKVIIYSSHEKSDIDRLEQLKRKLGISKAINKGESYLDIELVNELDGIDDLGVGSVNNGVNFETNGDNLILTGNTYPIRNWLKSNFDAVWVEDTKQWVIKTKGAREVIEKYLEVLNLGKEGYFNTAKKLFKEYIDSQKNIGLKYDPNLDKLYAAIGAAIRAGFEYIKDIVRSFNLYHYYKDSKFKEIVDKVFQKHYNRISVSYAIDVQDKDRGMIDDIVYSKIDKFNSPQEFIGEIDYFINQLDGIENFKSIIDVLEVIKDKVSTLETMQQVEYEIKKVYKSQKSFLAEKMFDNVLNPNTSNEKKLDILEGIKLLWGKLISNTDDKYYFVKKLQSDIYKKYGINSSQSVSINRRFEQISSIKTTANFTKADLTVLLFDGLDSSERDLFNRYIFAKRIIARYDNSEEKVTGNISSDLAKTYINDIELAANGYKEGLVKEFNDRATQMQLFFDSLLQKLVQVKYITNEQFLKVKENNDFYARFDVLNEDRFLGASDGKNIKTQSVINKIKGIRSDIDLSILSTDVAGNLNIINILSEYEKGLISKDKAINDMLYVSHALLFNGSITQEEFNIFIDGLSDGGFHIRDVVEATVTQAYKMQLNIEKQKYLNELYDLVKLDKNKDIANVIEMPEILSRYEDSIKGSGLGFVRYYREGTPYLLVMPENVSKVLNGEFDRISELWVTKMLKFSMNYIQRPVQITLNTLWLSSNLPRDIVRSISNKYGIIAGNTILERMLNAMALPIQIVEGLILSAQGNLGLGKDISFQKFLRESKSAHNIFGAQYANSVYVPNKGHTIANLLLPSTYLNIITHTMRYVTFIRGKQIERLEPIGATNRALAKLQNIKFLTENILKDGNAQEQEERLNLIIYEANNFALDPDFSNIPDAARIMGLFFSYFGASVKGAITDARRFVDVITLGKFKASGVEINDRDAKTLLTQKMAVYMGIVASAYYTIKSMLDDDDEDKLPDYLKSKLLIPTGEVFTADDNNGVKHITPDFRIITLRGEEAIIAHTSYEYFKFVKKKEPVLFSEIGNTLIKEYGYFNFRGAGAQEKVQSFISGTTIPIKVLFEASSGISYFSHYPIINKGRRGSPFVKSPQWESIANGLGVHPDWIDYYENTVLNNMVDKYRESKIFNFGLGYKRSQTKAPIKYNWDIRKAPNR